MCLVQLLSGLERGRKGEEEERETERPERERERSLFFMRFSLIRVPRGQMVEKEAFTHVKTLRVQWRASLFSHSTSLSVISVSCVYDSSHCASRCNLHSLLPSIEWNERRRQWQREQETLERETPEVREGRERKER